MKVSLKARGGWDKQENAQQQLACIYIVDLAHGAANGRRFYYRPCHPADGLNVGVDDERLACHDRVSNPGQPRRFFSLHTLSEILQFLPDRSGIRNF